MEAVLRLSLRLPYHRLRSGNRDVERTLPITKAETARSSLATILPNRRRAASFLSALHASSGVARQSNLSAQCIVQSALLCHAMPCHRCHVPPPATQHDATTGHRKNVEVHIVPAVGRLTRSRPNFGVACATPFFPLFPGPPGGDKERSERVPYHLAGRTQVQASDMIRCTSVTRKQ